MIFNLPGLSDIEALKSAELYEGNIDTAPLGLCRMNSGAVSWAGHGIVVWTIQTNPNKMQIAFADENIGQIRRRYYYNNEWGNWFTLPRSVADHLTSTDTSYALSAKQGYILKGLIDGLKSAELFTGSIDNAPLGLCRMNSGAVTWSSSEILVLTIQFNSNKWQYACNVSGGQKRRIYTGGSWQGWLSIPFDVADNLTNEGSTTALSANQGKVLDEKKLDKTGGTVNGSLNVETGAVYPFAIINSNNAANERVGIRFANGYLGNLGFLGVENNKKLFYTPQGGNQNEVHHDGNSRKVYFGTESNPPTDDNVLWVVLPS